MATLHSTDAVLPLSQCTLSLQGVDSIINHLRSHPVFANAPEDRLRGAAFGFLVAGSSSDNAVEFHPIHFDCTSRRTLPLHRGLRADYVGSVFDHVCAEFR